MKTFPQISSVLIFAATVIMLTSCQIGEDKNSDTPDTGTYTVSGTVTLSSPASKGTWQIYLVNSLTSTTSAAIATGSLSVSTSTIYYTMNAVPAGTYFLVGVLDSTGDGKIQGSGDMQGAYGTNISAYDMPAAANFHVSSSANLRGINFTIYTF
jgi:hypothetical protein